MWRKWPLRSARPSRVSTNKSCRLLVEGLEERLALDGSLTPVVIDNLNAGYAETGTWNNWPFGYNGSFRYIGPSASNGNSTATWQATNLTPGEYEVQVTWQGEFSRAPDAPYQILDDTTLRNTVRVNQRLNPVGTIVNGWAFQTLGTYEIDSGTLKVVLSNAVTTGFVIADAVRLVPIAPPNVDLNWSGGGLSSPTGGDDRTPFTITRAYNVSGEAPANDFTLSYFASQDTIFGNADDQLVGSETISGAAKGVGLHTGSSPSLAVLPQTVYYLFVRMDSGSAVRENNELNNVSAPLQVIRVSLTAEGRTVTGYEGNATGSQVVATFQDLLGPKNVNEYSASIDWGDGTSSAGTVAAQPGGGFQVLGNHTYAGIGIYPVSAVIQHQTGVSTTAHGLASIIDAPLTGESVPVQAVAGVPFTGVVARFTDANPAGQASEFSAAIDWSDGASSSGTVTASGSGFEVTGQHTYAASGPYTVLVQINSVNGSAVLVESPVRVTYVDVRFGGSGLSNPLVDENAGSFRVERSWVIGDDALSSDFRIRYIVSEDAIRGNADDVVLGSELITSAMDKSAGSHTGFSPALPMPTGAVFHLFAELDSDQAIAESDETNNLSAPLQIVRVLLSVTGQDVQAQEGVPSGPVVVAVFRDLAGPKDPGQYSATIVWGDGGSSAGTLEVQPDGTFLVRGDHTYAAIGAYPIDVTVSHLSGVSASVRSSANVTDAPLTGTGLALQAIANVSFTTIVARFTDANPAGLASEFSAAINWNDGSTSTGVVSPAGGGFAVVAQHTYASPGSYPVRVVVTSINGSTVTIDSSARVANVDLSFVGAGLANAVLSHAAGTFKVDRTYVISDDALSNDFRVRYIVSRDAVLGNADDVVVGSELIAATADKTAGSHTASSPALPMPAYAVFHVFAELDSDQAIIESNEANNLSAALRIVRVALSATARDFDAREDDPTGPVVVAIFTDLAGPKDVSQYSALIKWGDGNTTAGVLEVLPDGTFLVLGDHTYAAMGSYPVDVTVEHVSGVTANARGTATVREAPLTGLGEEIEAIAGAPFTGVVAHIERGSATLSPTGFTASITWGDGSVSVGRVVANANGGLDVIGSHTYASEDVYPVGVEVVAPDHSTLSIESEAVVDSQSGMARDRQTASLCFWIQQKGQNLIESFNGGHASKALATWLATTFPNLYGIRGGAYNLNGKTNDDVAKLIKKLAKSAGRNVEAQVLTTALNIYATTRSLGGDLARSYHFLVSDTGLGAAGQNVRRHGSAFGVDNNTVLNVYQLMRAMDEHASGGVIYREQNNLRFHSFAVFNALNQG